LRTENATPREMNMDLGDWLRGLGLGQCEDVFLRNEIDGSVLPDLTEGDFEKLGVPMGPRKRLLKAIANLDTTKPTQPERHALNIDRHRGAPPAYGHVLRPRGLDGHVGAA
jgi:SAM domain (Sterile alpha motif)